MLHVPGDICFFSQKIMKTVKWLLKNRFETIITAIITTSQHQKSASNQSSNNIPRNINEAREGRGKQSIMNSWAAISIKRKYKSEAVEEEELTIFPKAEAGGDADPNATHRVNELIPPLHR